ncbi:MAG: phage major capsid protein [Proteobacteria bacterium]|nr:phage major capsid protein [Pseudomonadota bacterium]
MHDYDIQKTFEDLSRTFEEFKKVNEERLTSLENKGHVDTDLHQKLERLQNHLDQSEQRVKQMEAQIHRPHLEPPEPFCTHIHAFMDYIRKGLDTPLLNYEQKSLATTSDRDGGYLVPSGLHDRLYATLQTTSIMRSIAHVREISSSALEILIDKDSADVGWVAETDERRETKTPELAKIRIPVHEMYARPRATQKLLDDANLNVEEWLSQKIAQKMATLENTAFIHGDGNNKPKGLLTYETASAARWEWGKLEEVKTGVDGGFIADKIPEAILNLFYSLKPPYLPGATWLMSRITQGALRMLKDPGSNQYLWQPPLAGFPSPTLLGYPVNLCDDMPNLVPKIASKAILFGNFKEGYQIVDRTGIRVLRDPYSAKPYVEFYTTHRVGGDVLNFEALKVLNATA